MLQLGNANFQDTITNLNLARLYFRICGHIRCKKPKVDFNENSKTLLHTTKRQL